MELKGKIKLINETNQISDSFQKRDLVITTSDEYPQHITVQFIQDKCAVLDSYKADDFVTIGINIRGKEWEKDGAIRYFNTIQGWKISKENDLKTQPVNPVPPVPVGESGDLPF